VQGRIAELQGQVTAIRQLDQLIAEHSRAALGTGKKFQGKIFAAQKSKSGSIYFGDLLKPVSRSLNRRPSSAQLLGFDAADAGRCPGDPYVSMLLNGGCGYEELELRSLLADQCRL